MSLPGIAPSTVQAAHLIGIRTRKENLLAMLQRKDITLVLQEHHTLGSSLQGELGKLLATKLRIILQFLGWVLEEVETVLHAKHTATGIVDATHRNLTFLHQFYKVATSIARIRFHNHIDTSIDGNAERILLVLCHHLTSIEIVDVCPVGDEHTIPSSLFLQPSCQDVLVGMHWHTVDGSGIHHHGQGSSLQTRQERSEVLLSQVGWRDIGWRTVFTGPRHTIAHEVLH